MRIPVLIAAAAASAATAQTPPAPKTPAIDVLYSLGASVIGGNHVMPLDPGESVLFQLSVSITHQNSTVSYYPPSPAPGSGTVRGFGSGFIDLIGTANNGGNANGTWNTDFVNPGFGPIADGWEAGPGGWGTPAASGSNLTNIQFGQFPINAAAIVTTNPINLMYQALWTPSSYASRSVRFAVQPAISSQGFPSSVMMQISSGAGVAGVLCNSWLGDFGFLMSPAPSSLAPFAIAGLVVSRRRRGARP